MYGIQHIYTNEDSLRKALLALSLLTVGRQNVSSNWMKEAGCKLYGNALQDMTAMLRTPCKRQENGILATVRVLSLFEVRIINNYIFLYFYLAPFLSRSKGLTRPIIARLSTGKMRDPA
jgi:hypothetical protein